MQQQTLSRILAALLIAFAATAGAAPIGVTVNSVHLNDDASINDPNWSYNSLTNELTLHGSGNFMVSGTNTAGKARIIIPNGVTNTVRFWVSVSRHPLMTNAFSHWAQMPASRSSSRVCCALSGLSLA